MSDEAVLERQWRLPALALRGVLFALVAVFGWASEGLADAATWCGILALAALPGVVLPRHRLLAPAGQLAEVAVVVLGTLATDGLPAAWLLPYLIAPFATAAFDAADPNAEDDRYARLRTWVPAVLVAVAAVGLIAQTPRISAYDRGAYVTTVAVALAFGLASAVGAWWMRRSRSSDMHHSQLPYAEAAALLTQLRVVARQLPGSTLDPGGIATEIVDTASRIPGVARAAVLSAASGRRLVVLAQHADERVDWETSPQLNSLLADAWAGQKPQAGQVPLSRSTQGPVASLVIPLVAEGRTVGLVAIESDDPAAFGPEAITAAEDRTKGAALRLETALLFEDVRSMATTEERQRLAREIHDGIAQELAMLGYGIDNAMAILPPEAEEAKGELEDLRSEVTRLVTELRFSLFELRSNVDRQGGLASAIADYARTVGASAGLRVHLSLDEGGARLPASTEAELLRIAQEAITNARKHARAENLWVTCEVDPPYTRIEVTDDGQGLSGEASEGRYGLAIMSERAERIRGSLEIRPHQPHGTTVAVVLNAGARPTPRAEAPRPGSAAWAAADRTSRTEQTARRPDHDKN
ncbi:MULTISPECIES: sensor histidine kinase [Glycomyces]|uniref:GAF domain-containing sensor histidine kinase n=2 Tax=Glycomyces TaxID=58113 RepID=A0A9X3PJS2_9ACTN|nr:GAF domain-containing sensor histidine kinase [Glycomyces lechevalierae]MDA1386781.1 GAF domain-containing sensor histidine kinase [Glycomyces lechevalierae]MDR7340228.1 signal transduction histidine kinase [Glycomyces lechevalierae]